MPSGRASSAPPRLQKRRRRAESPGRRARGAQNSPSPPAAACRRAAPSNDLARREAHARVDRARRARPRPPPSCGSRAASVVADGGHRRHRAVGAAGVDHDHLDRAEVGVCARAARHAPTTRASLYAGTITEIVRGGVDGGERHASRSARESSGVRSRSSK